MGVVFSLADQIAVLAAGQVVALGPPAAIRANPQVQAVYGGAHAAG
jgi:branched-chain amino acid transport system ATP-binding protein